MRRALLLSFVALLLLLTFLLQRAGAPDTLRHDRVLGALRDIDLMQASLQRDVLRARTGLLTSYDSLSALSDALRRQAEMLAAEAPELRPEAAVLQAALAEQDERLERFKTQNALVQSARRVVERAVRELVGPGPGPTDPAAAAVTRLAASVLRLASDPPSALPAEVMLAAERLAALPDAARHATLIAHARLIASALPAVNASVKALQEGPAAAPAQRFHAAYLESWGALSARARGFRLALYGAAMALAAYTLVLVLRLDHQARQLRQRLALEQLVAQTSAGLLNPPQGRMGLCVTPVLAGIGAHFGAGRSRIILRDPPEGAAPDQEWTRPEVPPGREGAALLRLLEAWPPGLRVPGGVALPGLVIVPDVARLPPGPARALLRRLGLRAWIGVRLGALGQDQAPLQGGSGLLSLEAEAPGMSALPRHATALQTLAHLFTAAFAREAAAAGQEALRRRLAHAERLEALGTLAGGIAHEFNNALGAMLGHAELALDILRRNSSPHRYVARILAGGAQAKAVVDQILTFSRAPAWRPVPLRPQPVVEEALEMIRVALPPGVTLQADLRAPEAVILGDAVGLRQIVVNLGRNAAQAMSQPPAESPDQPGGQGAEPRGVVRIHAASLQLPRGQGLSHGALPPGAYFHLSVADTGSGIPAALVARIFEPFFTTKTAGQGTGLGLAVVHGIVMEHGGALDVQSRENLGTRLSVYLPLRPDLSVPEAAPAAAEPALPRGRGERILLLEPEQAQRLLAEEMVAALGYEPVGLGSAAAAWARLRAAPEDFDLVLAAEDPADAEGLAGLARRLRALPAPPPLLRMVRPGVAPGPQPAGIAGSLARPLQFRPLAEALHRQLAARAAPGVGASE